MRICQLLVFFILSTLQLPAQRFLVSNENENLLYARVQNPVAVVVDGVDCKHLIVKTDNGTISAEDANKYSCKYIVLPEMPGTAKITLYKKYQRKLKKVGEMFFRVKQLPAPEPMVGNIDKDTVNKKMLIAMGGVRALQVNSNICATFEVLSYKVTLMRNDNTFAVINNTGARYNPVLLEHLYNLKSNDQIIFSDITVRYFDDKPFGLKMLSYKVTE
ncbi:GldM family protein [Terrimonas sp.]|uniref:GldM family protein n=1 Tax=Terrimonas sp. TaxID=1914338 RepID=UPI001401E0BF|nr:GldM family protein [Terrimonas sp.]